MAQRCFEDYAKNDVHFYVDNSIPKLLNWGFDLISAVKQPSIIDLGCSVGRLYYALFHKGLLDRFERIVGVDISSERITRLKNELPFVEAVVADASKMKSADLFDYVICSQVIEHVKDDGDLVTTINNLLKNRGIAYVSSVIKHWYVMYYYFNNGSIRLDPTHVREYTSMDEFLSLFRERKFEIINFKSHQVMFSILTYLIRSLIKYGLMEPDAFFYKKHKRLYEIAKLRTPIIGYKTCEVLVRKIE